MLSLHMIRLAGVTPHFLLALLGFFRLRRAGLAGSLTGVCTEAVSELPVREFVAQPLLMWEPVVLAAEEGWVPVALEGEIRVSLLALEARREGTGFVRRCL